MPEVISIKDSLVEIGEVSGLDNMSFSEIKADLDLKTKIKVENSGLINAQFSADTITLRLKNFDYLEYRYIDQGSVKAKVKVKVSCSVLPIQIKNLNGLAYAEATMENSSINLETISNGLMLSIGGIQVDLKNCQAPKNIEPLFVEALRDWIESKAGHDLLYEEVIGFTEPFIDELIVENLQDMKVLSESISLSSLHADFGDSFVSVRGKVSLLNLGNYNLKFSKNQNPRKPQNNFVVFPNSFFEKFLPIAFQSMKVPLSFSRSAIPGIDILFNRFIQTFVWGDLLNIKKDSNFVLDISLFNNRAAKLASSDTTLKYQISNQHWINMDFLSGEVVYPYMHFIGDTSAVVDLKVSNDSLKLTLTDVRAKTQSVWNSKIRTWRKDKLGGKPALSIVLPQALKGLEGLEYDLSLNELFDMSLISNMQLMNSTDYVGLTFN